MKKRIGALIVVGLCATLLAGCGSKGHNYGKYVTLGQYEGLTVSKDATTVSAEELDQQIQANLASSVTYKDVTRKTQKGDLVNMDYVGSIDGVEFEGGSTQGAGTNVIVGSSGYIDNFDEQLENRSVGETFDVIVTFPENYGKDELNGKEAVFKTTINSIQEPVYPDLTDAWVKDNSQYDNVDDYKMAVQMAIEEQKETAATENVDAQLMEAVVANATITGVPQKEVDKLTEDTIKTVKDSAFNAQMEYAQYLANYGYASVEDFENEVANNSSSFLKEKMVVYEIAKEIGVVDNDALVEAYAQEIAQEYNVEVSEVYDAYSDDEIHYNAVYMKVIEHLRNTAKISQAEE